MTTRDIDANTEQPAIVKTVAVQAGPDPLATETTRADLPRTTLAVFFMVGLAAAAVWILRPFVPAFIWATMVVVALWPVMLRLQARLWGKRWAAVAVMTTGLVLTLVIPSSVAVVGIAENVDQVSGLVQSIRNARLPVAPAWLVSVPVVGERASAGWNEFVAAGPGELGRRLEPYARDMTRWMLSQLGNLGMIFVQFLLTVILCAVLFARGEVAATGVLAFFRRLAGAHGEQVVILACHAIRGVALGVVVTALVQSVLGGVGLFVAGVPFPGLLTAFMFVLAVAQIGPGPVLIGAVVWTYATSDSAWMPTALLIWSLVVGALDNVLRPILIQRGGDLPLLMVFAGVVGGLLSFGLVGIFLGPVVLAVVYTLLKAWVRVEPQFPPDPSPRP